MFLMRRLTELSFPGIAAEFGGKHHTTVMHAVETVEGLLAHELTGAQVRQDLFKISKLLSNMGTRETVCVVTPPQGTIPLYRESPQA